MTEKWQAGKTYPPGSLVVPASSSAVINTAIENPGFETGDLTGWTQTLGSWSVSNIAPYAGSWSAQLSLGAGTLDTDYVAVQAGQHITASVQVQLINSGNNDGDGTIVLLWFDSDKTFLPNPTIGNHIRGHGGHYATATVSGYAPADAAYVQLRLQGTAPTSGGYIQFDNAAWDYAFVTPTPGIVYKATQDAPGKSGTSEPAWPGVVDVPVTDNQVTWEGVIASRVVWQAVPIMKSGDTEPTWPADAGATVHDGNMDWVAVTSRITDAKCPNSKVVAIMASKIFAADKDIVRFSATVNPLDWTSAQDAGYLPTGLQQANANDMAVLAPYRSNLTAFNASSFQNWQVDPDPAAMALLDQMDGIGSAWQHAAQPVGNDLFYLSQLGVRSVGIAAGTDSLQAGDVGMPIDPLVQSSVKDDNTSLGPRSTYYPSAGQYWLACAVNTPDAWVDALSATWKDGDGADVSFPYTSDTASVAVSYAAIAALLTDTQYIVDVRAEGTITDATGATVGHLAGWQWHDSPPQFYVQPLPEDGRLVLPAGEVPIYLFLTYGLRFYANTMGDGPFTVDLTKFDILVHDNATAIIPGNTFVCTMNGGKPKWGRYEFPFAVDAFAQLGNDLYIRHGDEISIVSEDVATDDVDGMATAFAGAVQWHWLDCGQPGTTKMLESVDYVGTGQAPSLSVGYDQRNLSAFTDPYAIDADTLPGGPIPIPVAAPTFSVRLDFTGGDTWAVNAVILHLDDLGGPP